METNSNISQLSTELARIDARISHIEWLLAHKPAGVTMFDEGAMRTEHMMLKYQDRGNVLVDLRLAVEAACEGRS